MTEKEYNSCKIGDTVICNTSLEHLPQKGWKGRIILKEKEDLSVGVEWEKPFDIGHNCNGLGERKKCRYYKSDIFNPLDQNIYILDLYEKQMEFDFS